MPPNPSPGSTGSGDNPKDMHEIKRISRTDTYLELFFGDSSVRSIDIAHYLNIDKPEIPGDEPVLLKVPIRPDRLAITWDDGSEIPADLLYEHSQLIGWIVQTDGDYVQAWQPLQFKTAQIKLEFSNNEGHSTLLLDGMPFPALRFSSVTFGIYETTAWYHVPFPGDDGVYEPEWEEPQIVFDTLDQLIQVADQAIAAHSNATVDITGLLQKTGYDLYVAPMSPRTSAIFANGFKKTDPGHENRPKPAPC